MALPAGRKGVLPSELTPEGKIKSGPAYELPVASADTLGGVKVGNGLSIADGVLSASQYSLPTASADTLGGVKVGSGLSITDGVLSASGGSGGGFTLELLDGTTHSGESFEKVVSNLTDYDGIAVSMDVNGSSSELQQLSFIMFSEKTGNVINGFAMAANISAGTASVAYFRFRKVSVWFATNTIAIDETVKIDVTTSGVSIDKQTNVGKVKGIYGIKLS